MSRFPIALILATVVSPFASGCDATPSDARPSPTSAPTGRPRAVTAKALGSGPAPQRDAPPQTFGAGAMKVTVQEAGDEPRRKLRYATDGIARTPKLGVELVPPRGPTLRIALGLDVRSAGNGMGFGVKEATVTSEGGPARGPQKAMFDRMRGGFSRVKGEVAMIDGRQPRLTQNQGQWTTPPVPWLLHTMMVPLPDEPVGVGATWTVEQEIDASGRKGRSKRRYEIQSDEDGVLEVKIGGDDQWKAAGGKADGTTTLSGSATLSVTDPLPSRAEMRVVEKVEATGKAPTGETTLSVRLGP